MTDEQKLLKKIAFNVIQGRVNAEDEGFDDGLEGQPAVTELVNEAIELGIDPKMIVVEGLTKSMEEVGKKFENQEYLIPDMLASAECVGAAMDILSPHLVKSGVESKGKFVIATVAGDLHDIGKNIVAIMLKGQGYEVVDLGTDVPSERIVDEVRKNGATFLGLSALLTTTMREMGNVINRAEEEGLRDSLKIFIGGASTSQEYAEKIGADAYCKDVFQLIDILSSKAQ
ncbi:MAG: corrinoid protein [Deltaproteobacteria bacterium]|nr:corrinoid protein [Deltaproteobacteria bacterium]